jgi:hypothetical protein
VPKTIALRHVPDSLHRLLKKRAADEGTSLSKYVLAELKRVAERPSLSELRERLGKRTVVEPGVSSARASREAREPGSR